MKKMIFNYILFQVILIICNISDLLCQIRIPKYHKSSILEQGYQIVNQIEPHSLFIHQFELKGKDVLFFFHSTIKDTLIYGYSSDNVENIIIKETDIPKYIAQTLFFQPSILENFAKFDVSLPYYNLLENNEQYLILVYCPLEVNCSYSLFFLDNSNKPFKINLIPNEPFLFQSKESSLFPIMITMQNITEKGIFSMSSTLYSGLIDLLEFSINGTTIDVKRELVGSMEYVNFVLEPNSIIEIEFSSIESSFVLFQTWFNKQETSEINIQIGLPQIHLIAYKEKQTLLIQKNLFSNNIPIILNIKAENCDLNLLNLSQKVTIFSDKPSYYQIISYEPDDYQFIISIDSSDPISNVDKCLYYSYAIEKGNSYHLVVMEGVFLKLDYQKITKL